MSDTERQLDERYSRRFGRVAGYLPKNRASVDAFQQQLSEQPASAITSPTVAALQQLIEADGVVRMGVSQMIDQVDAAHKHIADIPALLAALDRIVRSAPLFNRDPAKQNTFPVSSLFAYMMMTPAGEAVFRNVAFNEALRAILGEWCTFLDSPDSRAVLNDGDTAGCPSRRLNRTSCPNSSSRIVTRPTGDLRRSTRISIVRFDPNFGRFRIRTTPR